MKKEQFNIEVLDLTPPDEQYQNAWDQFKQDARDKEKAWVVVHPGYYPIYYQSYVTYSQGRDRVISALMKAGYPVLFFVEQRELAKDIQHSATIRRLLQGRRDKLEVPFEGRGYLVRTGNRNPEPV